MSARDANAQRPTFLHWWSAMLRLTVISTTAPEEWELSVVIPMKAFFLNDIKDVSGSEARANFYKCGDLTEVPHYLSWAPVDTETPAFHTPACFGHLIFD